MCCCDAQAKSVRIEAHKPQWREVSIQGHIVETEEHAAASPRARSYSVDGGATELPGGPVSLRQHLEMERRVLERLHALGTQQQQQTSIPAK